MDIFSSVVGSKVRKVSRLYVGDSPLVLDVGGVLSASPLDFGTALCLEFARNSSGASYSPNFRALRAVEEFRPLIFFYVWEVPESYNIHFTISELRFTIALCRDNTTWGADRTTSLRLYLVLVRPKLYYGAHVFPSYPTYFGPCPKRGPAPGD